MRILTFFFLAIALIASACTSPIATAGLDNISVLETSAPTVTAGSPTATIVWFPATSTWTPSPTIVPSATPELLPGMGQVVYQDDFGKLANWSDATTQSSGDNSIIMDRNRLTLAINITPATLASMNNDLTLGNFQADITISANRCFGPDVYGLLFHATNKAYGYRFLLNCSGQTRVDLVQDGHATALQDWVPSGDAPAGAPGLVKMGVWVAGTEMRFFLNNRYQFTVFNPYFKTGGLGVFANATSPDGVNISFSDLQVRTVEYASPTPTATPSKTATPTRTPRPIP